MANITVQAAPVAPAKAQAAPAKAQAAGGQYVALLTPGNPKKPGSKSAARWAQCHVHGQTVAAYVATTLAHGWPKGHGAADIRWEIAHGLISLHASAAQCPKRPVAPTATATAVAKAA